MRRLGTGLALLSTIVLAPGLASAQSTGSVLVSNYTFELVDLDLTDGITPSLTFAPSPAADQQAYVAASSEYYGQVGSDYSVGTNPVSAALSVPFGGGNSSVSGTLLSGLQIQGWGTATTLDGGRNNVLLTASTGFGQFVLSPMSSVTFRADAQFTGETGLAPAGGFPGYAYSEAVLVGRSELLADWAPAVDRASQTVFEGDSLQAKESLEITLVNNLARHINASFTTWGQVNVVSHTSPVPEPSTWAMLLAGAALVVRRAHHKAGGKTR